MADPDISVEVNWKQFDAAMRAVPGELYTSLRSRIFKHHQKHLNRFKRTQFKGGDNAVKTRSRSLSRSFDTVVRGLDLDSLIVETFSAGVPYAATQEAKETTIDAKPGGWLTIPLAAAKTASGVARGSARDFPNTFFRMSKAGNLILFQKGDDGLIPLFVLKKQITIRGKLGFIRTFKDLGSDFNRQINLGVKDALKPEVTS